MTRCLSILHFFLINIFLATVVFADFERGLAAFQKGKYKEAINFFKSSAEAGQYNRNLNLAKSIVAGTA